MLQSVRPLTHVMTASHTSEAKPGRISLLNKAIQYRNTSIPLAGLGTLKLESSKLITGLRNGFKLIDTAKAYGNEEIIGAAIRDSGIDRNSVTVITKLFNPNVVSPAKLREAVLDSQKKLEKIPEFFLIHAPYPEAPMLSLLQELETLKKEGHVKEWGVSNFDVEHLKLLIDHGFTPALNQVEYHPYFQRKELLNFCKQKGIILQAYRPLAEGKVLDHPTIQSIAADHKTTPASVVYTWLAQQELAIVTKVSSDSHQKEYAESDQFELSNEEMHAMNALHQPDGKGRTCTKGGWLTPFTPEIKQKWLEGIKDSFFLNRINLDQLKAHVDVLNIEGGLIPTKHFCKNKNQIWANLGIVLDRPFCNSLDLDQMTKLNTYPLKESSIPDYNETRVCLAHALLLKYYVSHAREITKASPKEEVKIIVQVHRGSSGKKQIEHLENALKICFQKDIRPIQCVFVYSNIKSLYEYPKENILVEFRWGYTPETIGHYEDADIVLSLSLVAGFNENLTSGSLVLPRTFIPMSLKDMVMKKQESYDAPNHLTKHLPKILDEQTEELVSAINKNFKSPNPAKQTLRADFLKSSDFHSVSLLQVDDLFIPQQLPSQFILQ